MSARSCTVAVAVVLAACPPQPAADERPRTAPTATVPAQTVAAAVPVDPPVDPPPPAPATPAMSSAPPLPSDGARAFVADSTGLVEVALPGRSQVVAPPGVTWCSVDARAEVVWFVDARGLQSFDLVDRGTRTIVAADLSNLEIIIDWGSEKLGGEDLLAFTVGVALRMTGAPSLATVMGCDGDLAVHCFEEDGTTPTEEVAKTRQRAGALQLVAPEYLATLATRGAKRSLAPPPPAPVKPPRKPAVPRERCGEEPELCGTLIAIPSSPLWLVVTANSRGDFYHEGRELWDRRTGEFIQLDSGALVRSKRPAAVEVVGSFAGLRVRDGKLSHEGMVFDDARMFYSPKVDEMLPISCGFTTGSWRVPGPTG